jgi:hypothetical protein
MPPRPTKWFDAMETPQAPATPIKRINPYEAARDVLRVLHEIYRQSKNRNWTVTADSAKFYEAGIDEEAVPKGLRVAVSAGFVAYGTKGYALTERGVHAFEDPELIERELPLAGSQLTRAPAKSTAEPEFAVSIPAEWVAESGVVESKAAAGKAPASGHVDLGALVVDPERRRAVAADSEELEDAMSRGRFKSALLLAGSILESLLIDVLARNPPLAAARLPGFPEAATLPALFAAASDPSLLAPSRLLLTAEASRVAAKVREAAPARGAPVDEERAQMAVRLLNVVARDIHDANQRGDLAAYAAQASDG